MLSGGCTPSDSQILELSPRRTSLSQRGWDNRPQCINGRCAAGGPLDHLRLTDAEYKEFLHALAWFMGGHLESVDAFLTEVPATADEHRVYWLRGNSIGSLAVSAHKGPQGQDEQTRLRGYVRPTSDIRRIELQDVQIEWLRSGFERFPDMRPTVRIHFEDDAIAVSVAGRTSEAARKQAVTFIDRLMAVLATS